MADISPRAARRAPRPSGPDAAAAPDSSFGYRRFRRMSAVPTAENRIQQVTIGRQQVRVAIRPGSAECTPLVIANGIGASLELLQPFIDALNPVIEVIRFDVPGSRGAPRPPPIRTPWPAAETARRDVDQSGIPARGHPGHRGVASSRSSSRCRIRGAAGGSSWSAPQRAH